MEHGLGVRWREDELVARYTCVSVQKLGGTTQQRLAPDHPLFARLVDVIEDDQLEPERW